jgi:hypothetical protein
MIKNASTRTFKKAAYPKMKDEKSSRVVLNRENLDSIAYTNSTAGSRHRTGDKLVKFNYKKINKQRFNEDY